MCQDLCLQSAGGGDEANGLWLHFVDEAVDFERKMALLRGIPVDPATDEDGTHCAVSDAT